MKNLFPCFLLIAAAFLKCNCLDAESNERGTGNINDPSPLNCTKALEPTLQEILRLTNYSYKGLDERCTVPVEEYMGIDDLETFMKETLNHPRIVTFYKPSCPASQQWKPVFIYFARFFDAMSVALHKEYKVSPVRYYAVSNEAYPNMKNHSNVKWFPEIHAFRAGSKMRDPSITRDAIHTLLVEQSGISYLPFDRFAAPSSRLRSPTPASDLTRSRPPTSDLTQGLVFLVLLLLLIVLAGCKKRSALDFNKNTTISACRDGNGEKESEQGQGLLGKTA